VTLLTHHLTVGLDGNTHAMKAESVRAASECGLPGIGSCADQNSQGLNGDKQSAQDYVLGEQSPIRAKPLDQHRAMDHRCNPGTVAARQDSNLRDNGEPRPACVRQKVRFMPPHRISAQAMCLSGPVSCSPCICNFHFLARCFSDACARGI
jgi:hypothetical protein